jgi:hypothetical protein
MAARISLSGALLSTAPVAAYTVTPPTKTRPTMVPGNWMVTLVSSFAGPPISDVSNLSTCSEKATDMAPSGSVLQTPSWDMTRRWGGASGRFGETIRADPVMPPARTPWKRKRRIMRIRSAGDVVDDVVRGCGVDSDSTAGAGGAGVDAGEPYRRSKYRPLTGRIDDDGSCGRLHNTTSHNTDTMAIQTLYALRYAGQSIGHSVSLVL